MSPSSRLVIIATLVAQGVLLSIAFPVTQLWTHTPLLYNDNAYHLYQMKLGHAFGKTGTLVGYDPAFAGGYPGGVPYNWSAKLPWLMAAGLPGVDDVVLYKLYVFLCGILAPVCIPLALRRLGLDALSMAAGATLAIILWWASWFHWLFTEGLVSFVTVSYLSVPYLVETLRYVEGEGNVRKLLALGIGGAALFFLHPHFPIIIVAGTLLSLSLAWPRPTLKRALLLLVLVPTLSLLPNIPWLIAMRQHTESGAMSTYFTAVDLNVVWKEPFGVYRGTAHGAKVYGPILLCALAALLFSRERRRVRIFALLGFSLIVLAAIGGTVPVIRNVQPNRFAPVGYLFLVIPAVLGLEVTWSTSEAGSGDLLALGARIATAAVGVVLAYCLYEVFVEVSDVNRGHYGQRPPQVAGLSPRTECLTNWLEHDTTRRARVLFEVQPGQGQGSDVAYYAYKTNREFIGGPMPEMFVANFVNGRLFGEPIGSMGEERFRRYLDLYNVGWILAHSAETKRALGRFTQVSEVKKCDDYTAYRVERPLNYFLEGRGVVARSGFNDLVLDNVEGDAVVLKYNYVPGLKSTPEAHIEPVAAMKGIPPFIRIVSPPKNLRLYLGNGASVREP